MLQSVNILINSTQIYRSFSSRILNFFPKVTIEFLCVHFACHTRKLTLIPYTCFIFFTLTKYTQQKKYRNMSQSQWWNQPHLTLKWFHFKTTQGAGNLIQVSAVIWTEAFHGEQAKYAMFHLVVYVHGKLLKSMFYYSDYSK